MKRRVLQWDGTGTLHRMAVKLLHHARTTVQIQDLSLQTIVHTPTRTGGVHRDGVNPQEIVLAAPKALRYSSTWTVTAFILRTPLVGFSLT